VEPDRELLIGRSEHADLRVQHRSVAPAHARIYLNDGEVFIEDLQTETGTFVDGQQVNGPQRLYHRQRVLLGQHSVVQPFVLRFDDPATQILVEMGLGRARTDSAGPSGAESSDVDTEAGSGAAPGPVEPLTQPVRRKSRFSSPGVMVGMLLGFLAVTAAVWGLLQILRPSAAVWRSVQISPSTLVEGGDLVVQSPDIHPRDDLVVSLGGQFAAERSSRRGRVVVVVPDLGSRAGGVYDIPLLVRRGKFEVCRRMVKYVVKPEISEVTPMRPEAGELLTIRGSGFADDPSRMEIHFGDEVVRPLSSAPSKMTVRVPVLTRADPVPVPIFVKLDDWVSSVEQPLEVRARVPRPLEYPFTAEYAKDRKAWLVKHLGGPAFHLAAAPPAEAGAVSGEVEIPRRIQENLDRWTSVFEVAREDPDVRIDVRSAGKRSSLVAVGGSLKEPFVLSSWEGNELAVFSAPHRTDLSSEMICFWMASIWNRFLDTFARGLPVEVQEPVPDYVTVLNDLLRWNLDGGGDGRPEMREVELLSSPQKEALAQAFMPVPPGIGSVSGRWRVRMDNLFAQPKNDYTVDLVLDLEQRRGRLRGTGALTLVSHEMEWKLAKTSVSGDLDMGIPTELKLDATFSNPVRRVRLKGTFENGVLSGVVENERGETGRWHAVREDAVAEQAAVGG